MRWLGLAAAGVLGACSAEEQGAPVALDGMLAYSRGCGDATLLITSEEDDLAVVIELDGVIALAHDLGEVLGVNAEPGRERVRVVRGVGVGNAICPILAQSTGEVDQSADGVDGAMRLDVGPRGSADASPQAAYVEMEVERLEAIGEDGQTFVLGWSIWEFEMHGGTRTTASEASVPAP